MEEQEPHFVKTEVIEEDNEQSGDAGNIEFIGLIKSEMLDQVKIEEPEMDMADLPNTSNESSSETVITKFLKTILMYLCEMVYLFQIDLGQHICRMCLENDATKPKSSVFHSINNSYKLADLILCLLGISVSNKFIVNQIQK